MTGVRSTARLLNLGYLSDLRDRGMRIHAVSYTHLDVYKRQQLEGARQERNRLHPEVMR